MFGLCKNIEGGEESLGGGFQDVLFPPLLGEVIQFDQYFSNGLKPPTRSPPTNKHYAKEID